MLGGAGHFSLVDSEVEVDAGDVEVDEVGLANVAEKVFHVGLVVHEEVFGEDCGAAGVSKEVEGGLDVGIAVGEVQPEALGRGCGSRRRCRGRWRGGRPECLWAWCRRTSRWRYTTDHLCRQRCNEWRRG